MGERTIYHGSRTKVQYPEIRIARYHKDFYYGFYCTNIWEQAERWATRMGKTGYINIYTFQDSSNLKYLKFDGKISRSAFWELAKFKYPTHQLSFHTARALESLEFIEGKEVHG